ncbi:MAG TPA: archaetidylserine decarboxylase [Longimicrobiales bacterium]|nr:archaetidylserine decarboxylase [Longimicrobiales bacterium]
MSSPDGMVPDVSPDLPGRHWRATIALLRRLPQAALSRGFGRLADMPLPRPLRRRVLGTFARAVGIDVSEAELPLEEYGSINAFFVRRLRAGARSWPRDDATIASPVDGVAGRSGGIRDGVLIQAKGRHYSAAALLDSEPDAAVFEGGAFLTIYLSPRHYHRIHAPCGGAIPMARHVPGALLPVNEPSVMHVADLFPRNERVICMIDGPMGRVAVVAVGAYNVGRISTAFDADWAGPGGSVANRGATVAETRRYDPPRRVSQGDEIMAFHLGSTIVALFEPGARLEAPPPGSDVRLGDVLLRAAPRIV